MTQPGSFESDRVLPLALSLRNSPGCYVAVVGAGLSTGSDIPAAGRIVDLLILQVAATRGETPSDPWDWYAQTFGEEPTYQGLLARLGPSTGDRHGILRPHFARTPEDEPPTRQPNGGHVGLARLARLGLVKVFVTTNFDRLIEEALQQQGLNPTTIATEGDLRDAPPLDTMEAVVIHIHGDWQRPDTLRNTEDELGEYPDWVQRLLGRSLEGRGFLIVGWSGRYDPALREALRANRTGRYSTYWLDLAEPAEAGRDLLVDLAGIVIEGDAAEVLSATTTTIELLAEQRVTATSGLALSVARAKKATGSGSRPIEALDRLGQEVDVIASSPALTARRFDGGDAAARANRTAIMNMARHAAALSMTLAMWGDDASFRHIVSGIRTLGKLPPSASGSTVLINQQQMPGVVLLAAAGIGAVAEDRWDRVGELLEGIHVPVLHENQDAPLATGVDLTQALAGTTSSLVSLEHPMSLLHAYLEDVNRSARVMSASQFDEAWEHWEYLWQVASFAHRNRPLSVPHLRVSGYSRNYVPSAKAWADRAATAHDQDLSFLASGTALDAFSEWFAEQAQEAAWSTIPAGEAGFLPNGGWRMDELGRTKVPIEERDAWKDFLSVE